MRLRRKAKEPKVPLATKNENMTLTQHLAELRMRLIRCLLAVVLFGVLVFVLYDPWIQDFLFHPYREVCAANPTSTATATRCSSPRSAASRPA